MRTSRSGRPLGPVGPNSIGARSRTRCPSWNATTRGRSSSTRSSARRSAPAVRRSPWCSQISNAWPHSPLSFHSPLTPTRWHVQPVRNDSSLSRAWSDTAQTGNVRKADVARTSADDARRCERSGVSRYVIALVVRLGSCGPLERRRPRIWIQIRGDVGRLHERCRPALGPP